MKCKQQIAGLKCRSKSLTTNKKNKTGLQPVSRPVELDQKQKERGMKKKNKERGKIRTKNYRN